MYTADPNKIKDAYLIKNIGYTEAQELSAMGAKVIHPQCIPPLKKFNIPCCLRWTKDPKVEGTFIGERDITNKDQSLVKAIVTRTKVYLISMESLNMWQLQSKWASDTKRPTANGTAFHLDAQNEKSVNRNRNERVERKDTHKTEKQLNSKPNP